MMRPSVQGVDPPVCCVLDVTVTYARDSFVDSQAGPFVLSRGGGGRYPGTRLTHRYANREQNKDERLCGDQHSSHPLSGCTCRPFIPDARGVAQVCKIH